MSATGLEEERVSKSHSEADNQGNLHNQIGLTGLLGLSFFLKAVVGLPIFFSLILSNLAFARRCCGVCA